MQTQANSTGQKDVEKVIALSPQLGVLIKLSSVSWTDSRWWRQTAAALDPHSQQRHQSGCGFWIQGYFFCVSIYCCSF